MEIGILGTLMSQLEDLLQQGTETCEKCWVAKCGADKLGSQFIICVLVEAYMKNSSMIAASN